MAYSCVGIQWFWSWTPRLWSFLSRWNSFVNLTWINLSKRLSIQKPYRCTKEEGLWHVSPHGFASPPKQSSPSSGNKRRLVRPQTLSNFVALLQKVCQISFFKNLTPVGREKLYQSSPKLLNTCYKPMPVIVLNFIELDQTIYQKRVTNYLATCEFWRPRGTPWAKVHQSWNWCTARPDLSMC